MNKPAFIELNYVVGNESHPVLVNIDNIIDIAKMSNQQSITKAIVSFGPDQYYMVTETFEQVKDALGKYTSILEAKE